MAGADVVYSDVIFTRTKENKETPASTFDNTSSKINISSSKSGFQQEASRSKVTLRSTLLLLSVLLAAAVIGLGVVSFDNFQTKKNEQTLNEEIEALRKSLSGAELRPACETGWDQHGGRCYYFSTSESTWIQSRDDCKAGGADLVQIDSEEEQWFLEYRLRRKMIDNKDKFWIGLTDSEEEGRWLWVDGSTLNTSWSFWINGEPDNWTGRNPAGEDCARMGVKAGAADLKCWFDQSCHENQRSICEKAAETVKCVWNPVKVASSGQNEEQRSTN